MKLVTVVGARPQFVKAAAVSQAITEHNQADPDEPIHEVLVHTGQHYDHELSGVFFDELSLSHPDHHLGIGSGPQGQQTGRMLEALEAVLLDERPATVLVYGDTNSTLAATLAATKLHLPIAHVEAGLRSFDRSMPEEVNRVLTDHAASLLLCPSRTAVQNLATEGIRRGVHHVGDVMHDLLLQHTQRLDPAPVLHRHGLEPGAYALATVHRAGNTDDPARLAAIIRALDRIARDQRPVLLPLHPRTEAALEREGLTLEHVQTTPPVPYDEMLALQQQAHVVLTDSGGVQKEAYWLATPCVTLRDETEWTETVETGWNVLAGADTDRIVEAATNPPVGKEPRDAYGDGRAAEAIVALLADPDTEAR